MIDDVILKKAKEQAVDRDTTVSELVNQSLRAYLNPAQAGSGRAVRFSLPVYAGTAGSSIAAITTEQIAELRDDGR